MAYFWWGYGGAMYYYLIFYVMSDSNLSTLLTSAVAVGASEAAPAVLDSVTADPSQLSQIVTQVLILVLTVVRLFKKKSV